MALEKARHEIDAQRQDGDEAEDDGEETAREFGGGAFEVAVDRALADQHPDSTCRFLFASGHVHLDGAHFRVLAAQAHAQLVEVAGVHRGDQSLGVLLDIEDVGVLAQAREDHIAVLVDYAHGHDVSVAFEENLDLSEDARVGLEVRQLGVLLFGLGCQAGDFLRQALALLLDETQGAVADVVLEALDEVCVEEYRCRAEKHQAQGEDQEDLGAQRQLREEHGLGVSMSRAPGRSVPRRRGRLHLVPGRPSGRPLPGDDAILGPIFR